MDKKALISAIHHVTNMTLSSENLSVTTTNELLVLITAAGQIIGTPWQVGHKLQENDKSGLENRLPSEIFLATSKFMAEQGEDSFILLKDAVLRTSGEKIAYQYLYVFTDDVIAATVTSTYPE